MSMLAERKQKQKWTLNPRGKYWSDDSNKFGQRMLEKMGWSSGKGLGSKEDGITEHIKQSYKNDSKGIGFEDKGDQWIKHEVDFSSLLENLSNSQDNEIKKPKTSLEKKSQSSRARVHYHKFTRGKDLSRYSEKELANVFGRKTLERKQNEETNSNSFNKEDSNKEFGIMTVNSGNMAEYFNTKVKSMVNKTKDEIESDNERAGFGFNQGNTLEKFNSSNDSRENNTFTSKFKNIFTKFHKSDIGTPEFEFVEKNNTEEVINKNKDKKKKNKTKVVINECFDNPGFTDIVQENVSDDTNKKNKPKKKRELMVFENFGLDINSLNDRIEYTTTSNQVKKSKKRKLETIDEESAIETNKNENKNIKANEDNIDECYTPTKKKSKKDKKKKEDKVENTETSEEPKKSKVNKEQQGIENKGCMYLNGLNEENATSENSYEIKLTKKKKNRINESGICNIACTELNVEDENITLEESRDIKSSKKKKNRINESGICNIACTEVSVEDENITLEESCDIKSSKKKKKRINESGICNIACTELNVEDENITLEESCVMKSSKKKKNLINESGICNLACTEVNVEDENMTLEESCDIKSSKKKKKRSDEVGIYNVACTEDYKNDTPEINVSEHVYEMKTSVKKKKHSIEVGIDNIAFTEGNCNENIITGAIEEITMPKEAKKSKKKILKENGVDNFACTANSAQQNIEEAISSMSNAIDDYQLELENEMNERKASIRKPAPRKRVSFHYMKYAKTSVKQFTCGELKYNFEGSNLPKIVGYGVNR